MSEGLAVATVKMSMVRLEELRHCKPVIEFLV